MQGLPPALQDPRCSRLRSFCRPRCFWRRHCRSGPSREGRRSTSRSLLLPLRRLRPPSRATIGRRPRRRSSLPPGSLGSGMG